MKSPIYLVKLKNSAKRPTVYYCILLNQLLQTFAESRSVFRSVFPNLLENSFSSLLAEIILQSHGFLSEFFFKLNMVILACELKLNCRDLRRVTVVTSTASSIMVCCTPDHAAIRRACGIQISKLVN